jgi:hypothetical protein
MKTVTRSYRHRSAETVKIKQSSVTVVRVGFKEHKPSVQAAYNTEDRTCGSRPEQEASHVDQEGK